MPKACVNCPIRDGGHSHEHLKNKPIAYFCAEYGIEDELPIYAGGLGILAGDFVRAAGERDVPIVAIGLFYRRGFKTYQFDSNHSDTYLDPKNYGFSLLQDKKGVPIVIDIQDDGSVFYAQVWTKMYGSAQLLLLDTDLEENSEENKEITHNLYDSRFRIRVFQELLLGIGGVKLIRKLGINPSIYHLNEGHTGFAALGLCLEYLHDNPNETSLQNALKAVRPEIVATKHTILSSAGAHFEKKEFSGIVDDYLARHNADFEEFFSLGRDEDHEKELFSMTKLLMISAIRENAVSIVHTVFEKRDHPHSELISITNGVNVNRWLSPRFTGGAMAKMSDQDLWEAHSQNRRELVSFVKEKTGADLNPEALTTVWARRFSAYKRPGILFSDLDRLHKLVSQTGKPIQFIISGQPSAADEKGIALLEQIIAYSKDKRFKDRIVYVPGYSVPTAKKLIYGADIWLSTPIRGREACGTSSMKSGLNGVLQCSTSDGWIDEVDWSNKGWILTDHGIEESLYSTFENEIIPTFHNRDESGVPKDWIKRMRSTIGIISEEYTTERMLEAYMHKLYFPCESVSPSLLH